MNMEQKEKVSFKQLPSNLDNFHVRVRDVAVYLTMRQFENWETHSTYVSIDKLAEKCGLTKNTIRKCIKNLILDEYLILIKRPGLSNEYLLYCTARQGKKHEKHLLHYRESNPTKTIMENQCYSHEPHWELSKKEVKNVFHYEESNLEKTIMENQRYPHGLR